MQKTLRRARRGRKPKQVRHPTNRVREFRDDRDLSQDELGKMIGVSGDTIGHLERSERGLSVIRAEQIAKALGVGTQDLMPDSEGATVPLTLRIAAALTDFTPDEFDIADPKTRYPTLANIGQPQFCFAAELVDDSYDRRFQPGTVFVAREIAARHRGLRVGDTVIIRHFATTRAAGDTFEVLAGRLSRALEGDLILETSSRNRQVSLAITIQRPPGRAGLAFRAQAEYGDLDPDISYTPGPDDESEILGVVEMVIANL